MSNLLLKNNYISNNSKENLDDDSIAILTPSNDHTQPSPHTSRGRRRTITPSNRNSNDISLTSLPFSYETSTSQSHQYNKINTINKISKLKSRRKIQRWRNDMLFGVPVIVFEANDSNSEGSEDDEEEDNEIFPIELHWKTTFDELFEEGNEELKERFIDGYNTIIDVNHTNHHNNRRNNNKKKRNNNLNNAMNDAEQRYIKIEKRLRKMLTKTIKKETLYQFICGLDALLQYFMLTFEIPTILPTQLETYFATPPYLNENNNNNETKINENEMKLNNNNNNNQLTINITLNDSPFHRLILHAMCQYYHLSSHSFDTESGRTTSIRLGKSAIKYGPPSLSLSQYLKVINHLEY